MDQLHRQVKIFERTVNSDISEENLHDSIAVYGDSFLTDVATISNVNTRSGCIQLLCSYAIALFRCVALFRYIKKHIRFLVEHISTNFQIQFISTCVSVDDLAIIPFSQISHSRRMKRQQKQVKKLTGKARLKA